MAKNAKRTNGWDLSMMGNFRKTHLIAEDNLQLIASRTKEEFVFAIFRKKTFA